MEYSMKAIFQAMKDMLPSADKWTQGMAFRNQKGYFMTDHEVNVKPGDMVSCCLMGAKWLAETDAGVTDFEDKQIIYDHMFSQLPPKHIVVARFNDHKDTTFQDVQDFLDRCIQTAPS